MLRKPAVCGQFYPANAQILRQQVATYLEPEAPKKEVRGAVVPHAGYMFSGPVAGAVYSRILFPDNFVILGPNHTGMGTSYSIMSEGKWETPLGEVSINSRLAQKILQYCPFLKDDEKAHLHEHSIEVQLPFLQNFEQPFQFVPIVLAEINPEVYRSIGTAIARAIQEETGKTLVLASSDFTHYEPQSVAKEKDHRAIQSILKLDEEKLLQEVARHNISMCGYGPCYVMLTSCKALGATKSELIKYQTSGDIIGDYSQVVGYAGILIW